MPKPYSIPAAVGVHKQVTEMLAATAGANKYAALGREAAGISKMFSTEKHAGLSAFGRDSEALKKLLGSDTSFTAAMGVHKQVTEMLAATAGANKYAALGREAAGISKMFSTEKHAGLSAFGRDSEALKKLLGSDTSFTAAMGVRKQVTEMLAATSGATKYAALGREAAGISKMFSTNPSVFAAVGINKKLVDFGGAGKLSALTALTRETESISKMLETSGLNALGRDTANIQTLLGRGGADAFLRREAADAVPDLTDDALAERHRLPLGITVEDLVVAWVVTMFVAGLVAFYLEQENRIGRTLSEYNPVSLALECWAAIELAMRLGDFTRGMFRKWFEGPADDRRDRPGL